MQRSLPKSVWIWMATVGAVALWLVVQELKAWRQPLASEWLIFAGLAVAAGVAGNFPIHSNFTMHRSSSVRLTNVFLVAGVVLLPVHLVAVLPAVALGLESCPTWRKPGTLRRLLFNASQTTVALLSACHWLRWWSWVPGSMGQTLVLLGAITIVTAVQVGLVAVIIALNSHISLRKVDSLIGPHLLSDQMVNLLGMMLGRIWLADAAVAALMAPLVYLTYALIRSAHLAYLGTVDPKTGVYTYKYFQELLVTEVDRAQRRGRPLALLFADLDLMRRVNTDHGHLAGDQVLSEVAGILAGVAQPQGTVGRFGGEEFVILLPNMNAAQAGQVAEEIRRKVESHDFHVGPGLSTRCTVSVGVAAYPQHAKSWEALVDCADMAMYRAKERRNAVVINA